MFNKEKKTGERLKVREELATIYSEIWQEEIRLTSKLQSQRSNVEQGIKKIHLYTFNEFISGTTVSEPQKSGTNWRL